MCGHKQIGIWQMSKLTIVDSNDVVNHWLMTGAVNINITNKQMFFIIFHDFLSFNMADLAQKYSDSADFSTFSFKIFGLCRFINIYLQISYL